MIVESTLPGKDDRHSIDDDYYWPTMSELREEQLQRSTQSQLMTLRLVHRVFSNLRFISKTLFRTIYVKIQPEEQCIKSLKRVASMVEHVFLRLTYLYRFQYNPEHYRLELERDRPDQMAIEQRVDSYNASHAKVIRRIESHALCQQIRVALHEILPGSELVIAAPRNDFSDYWLRTVNGWDLPELLDAYHRGGSSYLGRHYIPEYFYDTRPSYCEHGERVPGSSTGLVLCIFGGEDPALRLNMQQLTIDFRGWEDLLSARSLRWVNTKFEHLTRLCLRYSTHKDFAPGPQSNMWLETCCRTLQDLEVATGEKRCSWPDVHARHHPPMPSLRRLSVCRHIITIPDCIDWLRNCPKLESICFTQRSELGPVGGVDRLHRLFETLRSLPSLLEIRFDDVDAGLGSPDWLCSDGADELLSFTVYTRQAKTAGTVTSATNSTNLGQALQEYMSYDGDWEAVKAILEDKAEFEYWQTETLFSDSDDE